MIVGAKTVVKELKKAGFHPHPGVIDAKGGGGGEIRVKVVAESNRYRLVVTGSGVQEIFLYGKIDFPRLQEVLTSKISKVCFQ